MKTRMTGFQKPMSQPGTNGCVRVAVISYEGVAAVCSCGWLVRADRMKVREDSVDRHIEKKHNGMGIRL